MMRFLGCLVFLFWSVFVWAEEAVRFSPTEFTIETSGGAEIRFIGELARSPLQLSHGLKFRYELSDDYGMLFDLGEVRRASFWMRDTYVSLDMLFVSEDGRIESILAGVPPLSLQARRSRGAVRAVIEIKAGLATKHGIQVGDLVRHALF